MLIRCARASDLDGLLELSGMLPPGMTSMPFDRDAWVKKLEQVEASLQEPPPADREAMYLLVLEDNEGGAGGEGGKGGAGGKRGKSGSNNIAGCAGIVAGVGLTQPFYSYKISIDMKASKEAGIRRISSLLNLVNDFTGQTELISLYLMKQHRRGRNGQFLSRSRFLFMSDFPQRFSDTVFAEIRGWLDKKGDSPFWRHLGGKFFQLPFAEADFISAVNGSNFITELMPPFPVYLELLADEAKAIIGKPHDDAMPAMKLLEKEGFRYEDTIDIFDGGPVMQCRRNEIASIKSTRARTVESLLDTIEMDDEPKRGKKRKAESGTQSGEAALSGHKAFCILSNRRLADYRLVLGPIIYQGEEGITLRHQDAETLGIGIGDSVMTLALR